MMIALVLVCSPLMADGGAKGHDPIARWLNKHSHEVMQGTMAVMLLVGDHDTVHDTGATFDGMLTSLTAAEALKLVIDQPRPRQPSATDGFPSSHSAAAFAFARGLSDWRSSWSAAVYAFAAGVGWARVEEGYHTPEQVLAGAALGVWVAGASLESNGFLLHRGDGPAAFAGSSERSDGCEGFAGGPSVVLWRRAW